MTPQMLETIMKFYDIANGPLVLALGKNCHINWLHQMYCVA